MPFTCHPIQENHPADFSDFATSETIARVVDLYQRSHFNNIPMKTDCKGFPAIRLTAPGEAID
jgi:hypothetical protein